MIEYLIFAEDNSQDEGQQYRPHLVSNPNKIPLENILNIIRLSKNFDYSFYGTVQSKTEINNLNIPTIEEYFLRFFIYEFRDNLTNAKIILTFLPKTVIEYFYNTYLDQYKHPGRLNKKEEYFHTARRCVEDHLKRLE